MCKINIIGVPVKYGCDNEGPNLGPDTMRNQGLIDILKQTGKEIYDLGNIYIPPATNKDRDFDPHMKYFKQVCEITTNLAEQTSNSIATGAFPIVIGGDHSLGLGSVSGISKQLDNLCVLWIDAHGDINTYKTTGSRNMHGMPLAALMGEGDERLVNLFYEGTKIKYENVVMIGCRDLDAGEEELIENRGLTVQRMIEIREKGLEESIKEVINKIENQGIENIHISLDIDSIDPQYAPGTGTDVNKGFTPDELKSYLSAIISTGKLRSMGLVELNPLLDDKDMKTTNLCLDILQFVTSKI